AKDNPAPKKQSARVNPVVIVFISSIEPGFRFLVNVFQNTQACVSCMESSRANNLDCRRTPRRRETVHRQRDVSSCTHARAELSRPTKSQTPPSFTRERSTARQTKPSMTKTKCL